MWGRPPGLRPASRTAQTQRVWRPAAGVDACPTSTRGPLMQRFTGLLGLATILAIAWLFSAHKRAIKLRIILWGMGLQIAFALLVLKTDFGKVFQVIGAGVNAMLNYAEAGSNFVFGPLGIKSGPFGVVLAKLFPLFYRVLGTLSDYPIPLNAGIFGLMDRKAVDSVNALGERNRYLPGLRAWVGYRNAVVYYDRQDRLAGDGKLSFLSRIKYAMDAITSFS